MRKIVAIILVALFCLMPVGVAQATSVMDILQELVEKGLIRIEQQGNVLFLTAPAQILLKDGVAEQLDMTMLTQESRPEGTVILSRAFSNKDIVDMEFDENESLYLLERNTIYKLTGDGLTESKLGPEIVHKSVNGDLIFCKGIDFKARDLFVDGDGIYLLGGYDNDVSAIFKVNTDLSLSLKYKGVLRNGRSLNTSSAGDILISNHHGGFIYTHNSGYGYKQYDINETSSQGSYRLGYMRSALCDDSEAIWSNGDIYMFSAGFKYLVRYSPEADTTDQIADYGSMKCNAVATDGKCFYFNDKYDILKLDKDGNVSTYISSETIGENGIQEMAIDEYGDIAFFDKAKGIIKMIYKGD